MCIRDRDVLPYAAGGTLYKQHIYHYLLDSGQSEALFGRVKQELFSHGGPCDRRIEYPDPREAVAAIRADGGFAVLAHPGQQQNFALLPDLVDAGPVSYTHLDVYKRQVVQQQHSQLLDQAQKIIELNQGMLEALSAAIEFRNGESGEHVRRIHDIT